MNLQKIREELCVFLRNANVISKAQRGVTTYTDTYTALGAQTIFTVTQPGIKNVRSVKKNTIVLSYGGQYEVNYHEGDVQLSSSTIAGDIIAIEYDAGEGDKIYPDLPRTDIDLERYPRLGFEDISHNTTEQALNGDLLRTDVLISMVAYADKKDTVLEILSRARNAVIANRKSFFHFCYITPAGVGPMGQSAGRADKIVQKNQDFRIPFIYETG